MEGKKILIVDDEEDILEMLAYNFNKEGLRVSKAANGAEAIETAEKTRPDIILLDVMLPDMDGISVCETLRKKPAFKNTLILFLSARGEDYSQVAGYNAGADDYIVKPIRIKILMHKVKVLLDRVAVPAAESLTGISINPERFSISMNGKETIIPKKEFELLSLLMSVPHKVFRREEILNDVWGDTYIGDRTIDVHIRKLREKFGSDVIQTVKGVGYKFMG
ncbi:MAG: response regulator transcription factor [Bacteroidetes bacterium]|nr:response regulator transcription factor [Bacteroidota bacterium]